MHVVCVPNAEARAADMAAGFTLPFSIGRVCAVKGLRVTVSWLFAHFIDSVWNVWEQRGHNLLRRPLDDLEWKCLLADRVGVIKVEFTASKLLSKPSLTRIRAHPELATIPDLEWKTYFRKRV